MTRPRQVTLPGDPDADAPEWWRRAARLRRVPLIAAAVLVILMIRAMNAPPPPTLEADCNAADFAMSEYTINGQHRMGWTATGPAGTRFTLVIGAEEVRTTSSGLLQPVLKPGVDADTVHVTPPLEVGDDCLVDGSFRISLAPGKYQAGMFVVEPGAANGSLLDATTSKALTLTG
jgi:hypothetical protein